MCKMARKPGSSWTSGKTGLRPGACPGEVLDAFAYQGGFAMHLAPGARRVTLVESSEAALAMAKENARLNDFTNLDFVKENVFTLLERGGSGRAPVRSYLPGPAGLCQEPPGSAGAAKGYREINRRALQLLNPGGVLITSSCSYNLSEPEFLAIVREAVAAAARHA